MSQPILISHSADLQVKNRNVNLFNESLRTLKYMERIISDYKISIHVITGDLFEYPIPNDDERRLIYNHIVRLLNIPTLKHLIIIDGNHDLEKAHKATVSDTNAISTIASIFDILDASCKDKFHYLNTCEQLLIDNLRFIPFALTDKENWESLKNLIQSPEYLNIALYHAMIADYAIDKKLPIKTDKLDKLDIFPDNTLVMAGDIHEAYIVSDTERDVKFLYPGAPMIHTFGEGTYVSIGGDINYKLGKSKKFNIYKLDSNMKSATEMKLADKVIPWFVQYITIQLDSKTDYSLINYNLQQLDWYILCNEETTRVFIKIKSSNMFIKHEREIFNILKNMCSVADVTIQFEYDKLVQKDTYVDNPIVQEIIDTKLSETKIVDKSEFVITSNNVDNLLLNNNQLNSLFKSAANQLLEKIDENVSEIRSDLMELFNRQLILCMEQSSQRYDVHFKQVSCNNFMVLGSISLDLSEKEITRILGTNGIGKTTLYRLIRWILTGTIMEGMKSNQVVQNNLLVFNKNLPNNNLVEGILRLTINGYPVEIIRLVNRTWKKGVTEEQQLSQNWTDFISDSHREVNLRLYEKDSNFTGEYKSFIGANAELLVERYFGNTINNLLFLDQGKIKQILNTSPDKLNELILDYIGVDYLKKLEANLDGVKEDLMSIAKPKISKENLRENIIDADIAIEKAQKDADEAKKIEEDILKDIDSINQKIKDNQNKLEELGNIESQISEKTNSIKEKESEIEDLSKQQSEELKKPEFTEKEPKLDEVQITSNNGKIFEYSESVSTDEKRISDYKNNLKELNHKCLEYQTSYIDKTKQKKNELSQKRESLTSDFNLYKNQIANNISQLLQKFSEKYQEKYELKVSKESELKELDKQNEEYRQQIKNGYCPTCKRQYDNFTQEDINRIMRHVRENREQAESVTKEIQELSDWITTKYKPIQEKYHNAFNQVQSIQTIEDVEKFKKFNLQGFDTILDSIVTIINERNSIDSDNESLTEQLNKFNNEFNTFFTNVDFEFTISVDDELQDLIDNRRLIVESINKKEENRTASVEEIRKLKLANENIRNEYNKEFDKYRNSYNVYIRGCERIDSLNNQIRKNQEKLTQSRLKLIELKEELQNLEKQLPIYKEYKTNQENYESELAKHNQHLKFSREDYTRACLKKQSAENLKQQKQEEYDNLLKYEKNQIIWKIYSKLIKSNFKDIVFEYYRTFLNNTLNHLLSDVSFKLYWNNNSQLTMINQKDGVITYQPVQLSSGMETTFLGLSLIYCMHLLNVKNSVSHIFIDEISGTLNKGKELSYSAENYQELFVKILFKFKDKSIFLVDHNIDEIRDCKVYEVIPNGKYSIYQLR